MKRHVLIIFPDEWLSHSPTVLNLFETLRRNFDVTVLAVNDGTFHNDELLNEDFHFIQIPHRLARLFLRRVRAVYAIVKAYLLLLRVRQYRRSRPVDEVIAVDSVGLWVAQAAFWKCHFLSLEVNRDLFFRGCSPSRIQSVVIQTPERLSVLIPRQPPPTFFIQNAPSLAGIEVDRHQKSRFRGDLIYFGNVLPSRGIYTVLEAFDACMPCDYTLTIKGIIYQPCVRRHIMGRYEKLLKHGVLILDETYTSQADIVAYLSRFSIGFCIYDFSRISSNDFNYVSSPSGKLFNYYAAGVPVIGTDVLGLNSIRQFGAGVLLQEASSDKIRQGITQITANYGEFSRNCIRAAKHFDFDRASMRYALFLKSSTHP